MDNVPDAGISYILTSWLILISLIGNFPAFLIFEIRVQTVHSENQVNCAGMEIIVRLNF